MSGRLLLLEERPGGGTAAALLGGGRLHDLLLDPLPGDPVPIPGTIFAARLDRLASKLGGAFVRFADGSTGFLRETEGVPAGTGFPVQVSGTAEPGKAPPVTRRILLKGRLAILTPDAPGTNVSRQIREEAERARLAAVAAEAALPAGAGLILRSAAEGAPAEAIRAEIAALLAEFAALGPSGEGAPAASAARHALQDWTAPAPARVIVARPLHAALLAAGGFPAAVLAALGARVECADASPFADHGIAEEITRLRAPLVPLPGEARLAIEPTRALIAVDVNTGGDFSPAAALKANLAAARELPRQLRLRGLGGIVAVDFAPLSKRERPQVETALRQALKADPVETTLAGWTPLGLLELQRRRERRPLADLLPREPA